MTPETARDYLRLRRGIRDHVQRRRLTWTQANVFVWLCLDAEPRTGIVYSCAPHFSSAYDVSVHVVRKAFRHLLRLEWIYYEEWRGHRGVYPIGIYKYPLPEGIYTPSAEEWCAWRLATEDSHRAHRWVSRWVSHATDGQVKRDLSGESRGQSRGESPGVSQPGDKTGENRHHEDLSGESRGQSPGAPPGEGGASHPIEEEEGRRTSPEIPLDDLEERVIREWKSQYCNRYPVPPKMDLDHRRDRVRARSIIDRILERAEASGEQYNDEDVINAFGWAAGNAVQALGKDRCTLAWIESTIDQWIDWDAEAAS